MDENCKRQKEVERTYGGLLPAVEGHSLGTRYKVQARVTMRIVLLVVDEAVAQTLEGSDRLPRLSRLGFL